MKTALVSGIIQQGVMRTVFRTYKGVATRIGHEHEKDVLCENVLVIFTDSAE